MTINRNGGLVFWNTGSVGGSFYIKRNAPLSNVEYGILFALGFIGGIVLASFIL